MKILGFEILKEKKAVTPEIMEVMVPEISANHNRAGLVYGAAFVQSFDGEKTPGEIGPITELHMNYAGLRARSWEAYITSEIAKTVLNRYFIWIIGRGLRLQCTPSTAVLKSEGIDLDAESFNNLVEARFAIYTRSKQASHSGMSSLNDIAKSTYKNGKIGGDCLVILRYNGVNVTSELIDGEHVRGSFNNKAADGNRIFDGVEIDSTGKHIAYHVQKAEIGLGTERVEAWSKVTGLRVAFMVYGSKYRENELRGIPEIATSLETISKIERYKEAAVGSAEERAKIVYTIEHNAISDGASPIAGQLAKSLNPNSNGPMDPVDASGEALADTVAATTKKQTFNLTQGSKLVALESKQEMFFGEFYTTNAHIICAAVNIPPNIAFSLYNDSFSASRAATKDWENTMIVERDDFSSQFYDHVKAFWLHMEILTNKIEAPGYLIAFNNKNFMVTESYLNSRFTGSMFPHIDPLKEVKAEREKLGPLGANIPLTTVEAATEFLNGSDFGSNVEQFAKEVEKSKGLGLKIDPPTAEESSGGDSK